MDWNKKKDIAIVYDTTHKDHIYIAGVSDSQYLNEKLNIWAYLSIQLPRRYEYCNSHSKDYLAICDESIDWRHLRNTKGIPKLVLTLKPICSIYLTSYEFPNYVHCWLTGKHDSHFSQRIIYGEGGITWKKKSSTLDRIRAPKAASSRIVYAR